MEKAATDDRIVVNADDGDVVRDGETVHRTGDGHDGSRLVIDGEDSAGTRKVSRPGAELADEVNARDATHPTSGLKYGRGGFQCRKAIAEGLFAQTAPRAGRDQEGHETEIMGKLRRPSSSQKVNGRASSTTSAPCAHFLRRTDSATIRRNKTRGSEGSSLGAAVLLRSCSLNRPRVVRPKNMAAFL